MPKSSSPPTSDIVIHFNGSTFRLHEGTLCTLIEVYKDEVPANVNLLPSGLEFEVERISRNGIKAPVKKDEFSETALAYMLALAKLKPYEESH